MIDPGDQGPTILRRLNELGLRPEAILLTHGHFDHVGAVPALAHEATRCPVWLMEEELSLPEHSRPGPFSIPTAMTPRSRSRPGGLPSGSFPPRANSGVRVPLTQDALFSGDTLFAGNCGRVDFFRGKRAANAGLSPEAPGPAL